MSGIEVKEIDEDALVALERYHWPGNVRELRNAVERAVMIASGSTIGVADLPERIRGGSKEASVGDGVKDEVGQGPFKDQIRSYEIKLILDALEKTGGNQSEAAKLLDIPRRTLVHKMKAYGLRKKFER